MATEVSKSLQLIDELLIHGSLAAARERIGQLATRRIPREYVLKVASVARVAMLPDIAVRLLRPLVRPVTRGAGLASDAERAEYAGVLSDIGAEAEAMSLLKRVSAEAVPKKLLFEAWVHFRHWDYQRAIPLLESYAANSQLTISYRLGARVNLATALIQAGGPEHAAQLERGGKMIARVLAETSPRQNRLHHKHALITISQYCIFAGDYEKARAYLRALRETCLESADVYNTFRYRLWSAIAELRASPNSTLALVALSELRADANATRYWEIARSCDFYAALSVRDEARAQELYFGSPLPAFRERVRAAMPEFDFSARHYERRLGSGDRVVQLNVADGANSASTNHLNEGQLLQRLLETLACDFYRTPRLTELHELLFPDEYYNPVSSPNRVHQAVRRLRNWFEASGVPLELLETDGHYYLAACDGATCVLNIEIKTTARASGDEVNLRLRRRIERVRARFTSRLFSTPEAAQALGLSKRSANTCLRAACRAGLLASSGGGPTTRYRFVRAGSPPGRNILPTHASENYGR